MRLARNTAFLALSLLANLSSEVFALTSIYSCDLQSVSGLSPDVTRVRVSADNDCLGESGARIEYKTDDYDSSGHFTGVSGSIDFDDRFDKVWRDHPTKAFENSSRLFFWAGSAPEYEYVDCAEDCENVGGRQFYVKANCEP